MYSSTFWAGWDPNAKDQLLVRVLKPHVVADILDPAIACILPEHATTIQLRSDRIEDIAEADETICVVDPDNDLVGHSVSPKQELRRRIVVDSESAPGREPQALAAKTRLGLHDSQGE
jgi:hypothetical protein